MLLRLLYDDKLAQASYLVGCQACGEALVIDPNRHTDQYLDVAAREGLRVTAATSLPAARQRWATRQPR